MGNVAPPTGYGFQFINLYQIDTNPWFKNDRRQRESKRGFAFGDEIKTTPHHLWKKQRMLDSNKDIAIQRQMEAPKALLKEVELSRRAVEASKIAKDQEEDEIANWNAQIESELVKADDELKRLERWQDDCKQEKERLGREQKMKIELELHETKLKFDTDYQTKLTAKQPAESGKEVRAKLPKLTIITFDGTYMDCKRFWGQFEESVEKSGLASVAKFSYLKELLDSKAKQGEKLKLFRLPQKDLTQRRLY